MPGINSILSSTACAGLNWLSRRRLPQLDGTLRLSGLLAPVEVIRDAWGVPHIYARNTHDLMFAQGFVHAQDRLWQMDFQRRLPAGRLSEVLGPAALPVDRWMRIIGMRRVAAQEAAALHGEVRAHMEAYAAGVNAFIAQGCLPIEFTLLRYQPDPWTPADTLTWTKMMAWSLSVNWESELVRAHLIARLGPELAAELEPENDGRWPWVLPPGVDYAAIGRTAQEWALAARPIAGPPAQDGLGSNAWVIAGTRTASGMPLVANDLHQPMGAPSLWYENHLDGGDLHVSGCTFPGVMGIICGHNDHVAWGFSNGFPDVQDLYVERLRRADDGRIQYQFQDEWYDAQIIHETIGVRGRPAVTEDVIITRHGPVINALAPDLVGEEPLALRWTSHEPETMAWTFHYMNRARDCREFREALRYWTTPAENVIYADDQGNIGFMYPGRLPIRARGNGLVPVPGWTGEYEWKGYVPFEELPQALNPSQGYVATANNRTVGDDYPFHISCDYCSSDRACRIIELIEAAEEPIDVAYTQRMQLDQVSPGARAIAQCLGALTVDDAQLAEVVRLVREWDGRLAADSPAAAVVQVFCRRLLHLMLDDRLGDLVHSYLGQGPTPVVEDACLLGFRAWEWLQTVLADAQSHWFDLGHGETRDDVMRLALRQTVDHLWATQGPAISDWAWGKMHRLTYTHILSRTRPLDGFYNRGDYAIGGDFMTICATGAAPASESGPETIIGPSFRSIIDLGNLANSVAVLPPGQAGQPCSPHYDDQMEDWLVGRYHPMLYARADVERAARHRLQLLPDTPYE